MDLTKSFPRRVWLECGDDTPGFWQTIEYDRVPSYCENCKRLGHDITNCKALIPVVPKFHGPQETFVYRPKVNVQDPGPSKQNPQQQVPPVTEVPSSQQDASPLQKEPQISEVQTVKEVNIESEPDHQPHHDSTPPVVDPPNQAQESDSNIFKNMNLNDIIIPSYSLEDAGPKQKDANGADGIAYLNISPKAPRKCALEDIHLLHQNIIVSDEKQSSASISPIQVPIKQLDFGPPPIANEGEFIEVKKKKHRPSKKKASGSRVTRAKTKKKVAAALAPIFQSNVKSLSLECKRCCQCLFYKKNQTYHENSEYCNDCFVGTKKYPYLCF